MGTRKREQLARAAALGVAYFAVSAATVATTRFDGGVAFLWVATALLTAQLTALPARRWPLPVIACLLASATTTAFLGLGPAAALPIAVVNVAEGMIGAALLRRFASERGMLDSLRWLIAFVLATGLIAPAVGALGGAGVAYLVLDRPFASSALRWFTGHGLGTLTFMPVAIMAVRGDIARLLRALAPARLAELGALYALVVLGCIACFAQDRLPLLFLPLLPIIVATFRGGALASAGSIVIVAVIGGGFTLAGHGPINLIEASLGSKMQFLQAFLAATMLTVLPATAELERRAKLFRRLRDSEARYRLLTENSTDIILNLDLGGRIRFASSSVRQLAEREPAELLGRRVGEIILPEDFARVRDTHARAMADPDHVAIGEYRSVTPSGETRWYEALTRAVVDERRVVGLVVAARDITLRKAREDQLARAALTDPLTGLANRRAFRDALGQELAGMEGGCIALFDLDHFKQVNDNHGHAAGDEVLRRFAAVARSSVREHDMVARLGGEEFAVILPGAAIDQARLICDRLRAAIAGTRVRAGERQVAVTVSGGVARYHSGDCDAVLHAADAALYEAKAAGRDRLALAA